MPAPVAPLGGAVDPVHYELLRFADAVRRAYRLSDAFGSFPRGTRRIAGGPSASAVDRLAMLRLAVTQFPCLVADDRELRRPGKS